MKFITGVTKKETWDLQELTTAPSGTPVKVDGTVHTVRRMGAAAFIILRKREGLLQCTLEQEEAENQTGISLKQIKEAFSLEIEGELKKEHRAPNGIEIRIKSVTILSKPYEPMPLAVSRPRLNTALDTKLSLRPIALRNIRERAKFKIQEGLIRAFRDYLYSQGFTEIHTPKITAKGAEGGSNIFKLEYFTKKAVLAQSPQFYKQTMAGIYDRVFETAPVFRAEKHNTKRHLNEYTSLDLEMAYITGFEEIMEIETGYLQYAVKLLETEYKKELNLLETRLPQTQAIPQVKFREAKRLISEHYNRPTRTPWDLEPEEEILISRYFKEKYDADFVFVTHYPSKKRPFYAMDDPGEPECTLSFDLIFRGMEITTGGQRIHDYLMLTQKMEKRGIAEEGLKHYLMAFKHGMPPHGGLGIGLERLTMKLLDEDNVRETTLFPRDLSRLEP